MLGDLAELGDQAETLLNALGRRAAAAGIDRLFTVGTLSGAASQGFSAAGKGEARHFAEQQALIDALGEDIGAEDTLLIKGSRAARMDRVVLALSQTLGEEVEGC